jgi:hypothetical protein
VVVDIPPKINEGAAREVDVEVMPPESEGRFGRTESDPTPVHALSALTLVAVDSLWLAFDVAPPLWPFAVPLCFVAVFFPVFLLQKFLKRDSNGRALAFATLLATLAAIPTPVSGTPVGIALLAWSGIGKLFSSANAAKWGKALFRARNGM